VNIFVLDSDPIIAAQMTCDKHCSKMIVESGQMLSTAHRILDGTLERRPSKSGKTMVKYWTLDHDEDLIYKAVHMGHPCTVWSMMSSQNYDWHYQHFKGLADEFRYRRGYDHQTWLKLKDVLKSPPKNIEHGGLTPFAIAMKQFPECIVEDDPVQSYRNYYVMAKPFAKWEWRRPTPDWFINMRQHMLLQEQEGAMND